MFATSTTFPFVDCSIHLKIFKFDFLVEEQLGYKDWSWRIVILLVL